MLTCYAVDCLFCLLVVISPDDTPWEGGTFNLTLEFSEDYPNKAPTVRFITKMFHPNSTPPSSFLYIA